MLRRLKRRRCSCIFVVFNIFLVDTVGDLAHGKDMNGTEGRGCIYPMR